MIAARFHQDTLTHIELIWHEQQIEHWIRFGRDVAEKILDRRRRILSFAPNSIVAYVRWASGDFGTIVSRIDILRTVRRGEGFSTVPYVRPGGEILLRASGWPKVERVLQAIDAVEQIGIDAADACPDHWRHVHNRLAAGRSAAPLQPRAAPGLAPAQEDRRMTRLAWIMIDLLRGALRGDVRALPSRPEADLERQRQCADRVSTAVRPAGAFTLATLVVVRPPEAARSLPGRRAAIWRGACRF